MLLVGLFFLVCGIIIIAFPEIIAYLIGFLLVFIGGNILILYFYDKKGAKNKEEYIKFGKYKIYRK